MQILTFVQQHKYLETLIITIPMMQTVHPQFLMHIFTAIHLLSDQNTRTLTCAYMFTRSLHLHSRTAELSFMGFCFFVTQCVVLCFRIQIELSNRPQKEVKQLNHAVLSYKPVAAHSVNVSNRIIHYHQPGV